MNWGTTVQLSGSGVSADLVFLHTVHYWLMKPPFEAQPCFQHRRLPLISGSTAIWVSGHLCGYLVRTQWQNLPFCLEKTRHEVSQPAEGCQGEGEEGFELGEWTRLMEDKDGQHWKHWGRAPLSWHKNPELLPAMVPVLLTGALCVFLFLLDLSFPKVGQPLPEHRPRFAGVCEWSWGSTAPSPPRPAAPLA